MSGFVADFTRGIAKSYAVRLDQKIRVVLKPKPRFLTEKMWAKLASIFIYVEKTEPSLTVTSGLPGNTKGTKQ